MKKPIKLDDFKKSRRSSINFNDNFRRQLTKTDELAVFVTEKVGTMGFFIVIVAWTLIWLGWNLLAPESLQFDKPMGFVFWLFISNLIQILLMPLIMVGQNIQGKRSEARAEHDYKINIKAEKEIEMLMEHLEYQNHMVMKIIKKIEKIVPMDDSNRASR